MQIARADRFQIQLIVLPLNMADAPLHSITWVRWKADKNFDGIHRLLENNPGIGANYAPYAVTSLSSVRMSLEVSNSL